MCFFVIPFWGADSIIDFSDLPNFYRHVSEGPLPLTHHHPPLTVLQVGILTISETQLDCKILSECRNQQPKINCSWSGYTCISDSLPYCNFFLEVFVYIFTYFIFAQFNTQI